MGTRGLIGCRWDGELHGSYNHFDSYPDGLGQEVVDFCFMLAADADMFETFARNYKAVEWIEDQDDLPTVEQMDKAKRAGFVVETKYLDDLQAQGINAGQKRNWYWTTRDMQGVGNFLQVLKGWPFLIDSSGFIEDSLFCEYAYVLDLDRRVLEFYKGFQEVHEGEPGYDELDSDVHNEHWVKFDSGHKAVKGKPYKYGPCKKVGERSIDALDDWKTIYNDSEDEDD